MLRRSILTASVLAALTLALASTTGAKGPPERVTLAGPDWYGEIEVNDPSTLRSLSMAVFEDIESPVETFEPLGRGYLMNRGFLEDGRFKPFDRVLYFPSPSGGRGYVYYLEIVNGQGPYDGRWYHASEEGEAAIREVLSAHHVKLPVARAPVDVHSASGQAEAVTGPTASGPTVSNASQVDSSVAGSAPAADRPDDPPLPLWLPALIAGVATGWMVGRRGNRAPSEPEGDV